jgi:hypothetical protein
VKKKRQKPPEGLVEISALLDGAMRRLGVRGDWEKYRIEEKCRQWLGADCSQALVRVGEDKGTVTLFFNHSAFLQELQYRREEGLAYLKDAFPRMKIRDLRAALSQETTKRR